jgi:putative transcriptional regulator
MKLPSHEAHFTFKGGVKMKNNVKNLRTKANMTQVELAKLVNVSSRTIISIENEKYNPSLILAYRIAEIFKVSMEDLYCLKENNALEDQQNE